MITIYGKPQCPYCDKAKALCDMRGLEYTYKTLGTDYQIDELLETFPGAKTVPQIIINEQKIGGYTEFSKYIDDTNYNGTGNAVGHG